MDAQIIRPSDDSVAVRGHQRRTRRADEAAVAYIQEENKK